MTYQRDKDFVLYQIRSLLEEKLPASESKWVVDTISDPRRRDRLIELLQALRDADMEVSE